MQALHRTCNPWFLYNVVRQKHLRMRGWTPRIMDVVCLFSYLLPMKICWKSRIILFNSHENYLSNRITMLESEWTVGWWYVVWALPEYKWGPNKTFFLHATTLNSKLDKQKRNFAKVWKEVIFILSTQYWRSGIVKKIELHGMAVH